jgi:GNAT superfamily N-acetyltransferase
VSLEIVEYIGADIGDVVPDLAQLRMTVFREFPYLYEGSLEYEAQYLQTYLECPQSLIAVVRDGSSIVGATSALPLEAEVTALQSPFLETGFDVQTVLYLGESVLLPEYRGRGLGVQFFEAREHHAKRLGGFETTAFCAVQRPDDHPRRPKDYVPLESFWEKRGYQKRDDMIAQIHWRDIGELEETPKPMVFWTKLLLSD